MLLQSQSLDIVPVSSREFRDIQAIVDGRFTLKRVCDMKKTQSS